MFLNLFHHYKKRIFSLKASILIVFIPLFIATVIIVLTTTSILFYRTLAYTSRALMQSVSNSILVKVNDGLSPLFIQTKFTAALLQQGALQSNQTDLIPYNNAVLQTLPVAESVFWGDSKGDMIDAENEYDGSITNILVHAKGPIFSRTFLFHNLKGQITHRQTSTTNIADIRLRPWFLEAKEAKRAIWTKIYQFIMTPGQSSVKLSAFGISTGVPVYNKQGKFKGVFGIATTFSFLTNFIDRIQISPHGYAFIITRNENLIAYPHKSPFIDVYLPPTQLFNVHKYKLPLIDQSIDLYKATNQAELTLIYKGQTYLVSYTSVPLLEEYGWLIGVVVPKSDFIGPLLKMNLHALIISFIVLIAGIFIISKLIRKIVQPIDTLVKETDQIKEFNLDEDSHIDSHIKEIVSLDNALHDMKIGLKSFQKFVPQILVRQLIAAGKDIKIGGERKKLAIYFSDIENFTTIAEKMDSNQLTQQICTYFEELTQILVKEKGTIDKYIGDSIMAFWGAPLPEETPCHRAARASLHCQTKVKEMNALWVKQGLPELKTRIGLHYGEAIVGNVGSSWRLNYTALGDTVNFTSRLEQINKIYKTKIIVSSAFYEIIKDKFILRLVDRLAVKGRSETSLIYELLSEDVHHLTFDFQAYESHFERAFAAFEKKEWEVALIEFNQCLTIYPEDTVAPIFIARCKKIL